MLPSKPESAPEKSADEFVSVDLRFFAPERPPRVDLYLRLRRSDTKTLAQFAASGLPIVVANGSPHVLYCRADVPLSADARDQLLASGINRLHYRVTDGSVRARQWTMADILELPDTEVPTTVKTSLVYQGIAVTAKRVFSHPTATDLLAMTTQTATTVVREIVASPECLRPVITALRHDPGMFSHAANVCTYALGLGRLAGLKANDLIDLGTGAFLHDVGMAKVPAEILRKPSPLSRRDRIAIERHPLWGAEALPIELRRRQPVHNIVMQHHERLDGSGYPSGLAGTQIDYLARVVALVDKFDAMTSPRIFREAMSPYEAMRLIREEMAGEFERDLFIPMLHMLGPEP